MTDAITKLEQDKLAEGIEMGMKQGMEKGIEKGIEKGVATGRMSAFREVAAGLLRNGLHHDMVMQLTGLSEQELKKLHTQI